MASIFRTITSKINPVITKNSIRFIHCSKKTCSCGREELRDILFALVQVESPKKLRKVSVIGVAGCQGTAIAYTFLLKRLCDEIILYDLPEQKEKICGEVLDFLHSASQSSHPNVKICLDGANTRDSDILLVCGGVGGKKKGVTRLDLVHKNVDIFRKMIPPLAALSPKAVIIVITNPVDIMTYAACKFSGFPKCRVIGSGTELDSSRFRYLIGKKLGISPCSVNAWIIGEHGDSSVACWFTVNVASTRLYEVNDGIGTECDDECWIQIHQQVIQAGYLLVAMKECSNWGISVTVENLARAILGNKKTVHCVSTYCKGVHGIESDSFISLPVVLGNRGVCQIVKQYLDGNELKQLHNSIKILDNVKNSVKW